MTLKKSQKTNLLLVVFISIFLSLIFVPDINLILCLFAVIVMLLFHGADIKYKLMFKMEHYLYFFAILFFGLLLSPLYFIYPYYDKIQHFVLPFILSSIIFHMIAKLNLAFKWKLIFTHFTVISILTVFEICEFGLDKLFSMHLQGVYLNALGSLNTILDPLDDTIIDLIFGFLGSATYIFIHLPFFKYKNVKLN